MRVLAISGSLRADSLNRRLLEAARGVGAELGVELEILEPDAIRALPHFEQELESDPGDAVDALRRRIAEADALLIATPEYNGSVPGALKNAVDWASRPRSDAALRGKPAAVVGASPSPFGAVWAQADLRRVLSTAGARVSERELAVGAAEQAFNADGGLADPDAGAELARILAELRDEADADRRAEPVAAAA